MRFWPVFPAVITALLVTAGPAAAQSPLAWDSRSTQVTRAELQEIADRLEQAAASPGYSRSLREQARREAAFINSRLEHGDFQVGDRVVLRTGRTPVPPDTLTVQSGRVITVPDIGEISLDGVLRSELQSHLEAELGRFVQDPQVRTQTLIRIAVLGRVGAQGFYAIPAEALVEDAIMIAGGPAEGADLDGIEIRRGDRVIWAGTAVEQAIIDGRTLDQLNLRAGDRIVIPGEGGGVFGLGTLRSILALAPSIVFLATRIF